MADHAAHPTPAAAFSGPDGKRVGDSAWRIVDTAFENGTTFFQTWQAWEAWQNAPDCPQALHYVALASAAPDLAAISRAHQTLGANPDHLAQLVQAWQPIEPGFQRIVLAQGRLHLTVCIGPVQASLRELSFEADRICLGTPSPLTNAETWSPWLGKALARLCRRGTELWGVGLENSSRAILAGCGFELQGHALMHGEPRALGEYSPRWPIRQTRQTRQTGLARRADTGRCVVVGAGLAGASAAAALAQRGWQVDVLDQADGPAAGASGLPVGLLVPHVSADDCLLSRLSRSGMRMTLAQARQWLREGQDWAPSGALGLPLPTRHPVESEGVTPERAEHWHPHGAWIKPAALVRAWLAQPGIRYLGGRAVATLRQDPHHWSVRDPENQEIVRAERVILANGLGALPLLAQLQKVLFQTDTPAWQLPRLSGVHGLVSWGFDDEVPDARFPAWPVNGAGSLVPGVPVEGRRAWFVGAGYHPIDAPLPSPDDCHRSNLGRLSQLLPELARDLAPAFDAARVRSWAQIRCATPDRLPLVGPLDDRLAPGLWLFTGLGSRGLTFSALGAELIAAQWAGDPLPLPESQARKFDAMRHADSGLNGAQRSLR